MERPLVSIIIPCFNAGSYIEETLSSAFAQTWPHCEVILVDDGSTDDSMARAQPFTSRGLRLFSQPNAGASATRNHGLREARGAYIQFLDADDLLAPNKIERQMATLSQATPRTLASGAWSRFQRDPTEAKFDWLPNWKDLTGVEFLQTFYETETMMHPAAWLAPRSLLDSAGPWNESLSLNDDGEYFARVALAADRIRFCDTARSYYRSGLPGSLSRRKDRRSLESLFHSVELMIGHLLRADSSPRTVSAAAYGWKWLAFELYPEAPDLSRRAEELSNSLGGSPRRFPGSGRFQLAARVLGWRLAKRLVG